jgi:hypothetical protein
MKFNFLILDLFQSLFIFSQEGWNQNILKKNKVEKVSSYMVVPKTNPDYWTEPIGLMLISENFFNKNGKEIKSICFNCAKASHSDSKDIKKTYFYDNDRLVKMNKIGFDTINIEYLYFENQLKNIELKVNNKGDRVGLNIIELDKQGSELQRKEFDFDSANELNDFEVYYDLTKKMYSENKIEEIIKSKSFRISMEDLKIVKTSKDLLEIEKAIDNFEKSVKSDRYKDFTTYFFDTKNTLKEKRTRYDSNKSREDVIKYNYNEKGLLIGTKVRYGVLNGINKYIYKFRD